MMKTHNNTSTWLVWSAGKIESRLDCRATGTRTKYTLPYMRFCIYPFIAWLLKSSVFPCFLFSLSSLPVFFCFSMFLSVSGNLIARFPSQAVGETVTELWKATVTKAHPLSLLVSPPEPSGFPSFYIPVSLRHTFSSISPHRRSLGFLSSIRLLQ